MHGIELKFVPHMRYHLDTRQKQHLRNAIMKHKQVLANLVEMKLEDFAEIDLLACALEDKTIRQLIMELETKDGNKTFIAIERF